MPPSHVVKMDTCRCDVAATAAAAAVPCRCGQRGPGARARPSPYPTPRGTGTILAADWSAGSILGADWSACSVLAADWSVAKEGFGAVIKSDNAGTFILEKHPDFPCTMDYEHAKLYYIFNINICSCDFSGFFQGSCLNCPNCRKIYGNS